MFNNLPQAGEESHPEEQKQGNCSPDLNINLKNPKRLDFADVALFFNNREGYPVSF